MAIDINVKSVDVCIEELPPRTPQNYTFLIKPTWLQRIFLRKKWINVTKVMMDITNGHLIFRGKEGPLLIVPPGQWLAVELVC